MIKINVLNAAKAFLTAKQSGKQDTADILEKARRLIDQAKLSPEYKDQTSTLVPSPKGAETEQLIKQCCKIAHQTLREEDAARLSTGDRP